MKKNLDNFTEVKLTIIFVLLPPPSSQLEYQDWKSEV